MGNKRIIIILSIVVAIVLIVATAIIVLNNTNENNEEPIIRVEENVAEQNIVEEKVELEDDDINFEALETLTKKGKNTSKRMNYKDENGQVAVIPAGFAVLSDSGNISDGLVISDIPDDDLDNSKKGNQFVWIPVDNPVLDVRNLKDDASINKKIKETNDKGIYPMAIRISDENYASILYKFENIRENTAINITALNYSSTSTEKEPSNLDNSLDNNVNIQNWTNIMYQKEYNELIAKVRNDKGFWIARFETSLNAEGIAQSKKDEQVLTNINWYELYQKEKTFEINVVSDDSNQSLQNSTEQQVEQQMTHSHMIWGSQWDQIMIWLRDIKNENVNGNAFYITNSTYMGNYADTEIKEINEKGKEITVKAKGTSIRYNTGYMKNSIVKNIYDLAGNAFEWTMESYYESLRTVRGGYCAYDAQTYPVSTRFSFKPDYNGEQLINIGSRMTIY